MPHTLKIALLCALHLTVATAATITWDGGGTDALWTNGPNWSTNNAPAAADTAAFATAFTSGTAISLNGNKTIALVTISSTSDFSINNNTLTLSSGDITRTATSGTTTINSNVALGGAAAWNIAGNLNVNGIISGGQTMAKTGTGILTLAGNNSYTGATTITTGAVVIQHATALGTTAAGTTVSSGAALRLTGGIAVGAETLSLSGTGITNQGALQNLSGNNSWAGNITVANVAGVHRINSDSGTLTLSGTITETGNTNNKDFTFGGTGNINITGNITLSGTGDIRIFKDGTGTTTFAGTNNYDGATNISGGTLVAASATALGTTAAGTTVANGGSLGLQGNISIGAEALSIIGTGAGGAGAIRNISGNNTFAGLITQTGASRINSDSGTLTLSNAGTISGAFGLTFGGAGNITTNSIIGIGTNTLTKDGDGTLTLNGTVANTFTGVVQAYGGTLILSNTVINGNVPGSIVVGDGIGTDTVRLTLNGQLGNSSPVTVNSSGVLTFDAGVLDTVGTITMTGGQINTGTGNIFASGNITTNSHTTSALISGKLNLNANGNTDPAALRTITTADGAAPIDLTISAAIADGAMVKAGAGTLEVSNANTYTGGTTITAGTMLVNNTSGSGTGTGTITVNANGTLGGSGIISGNTSVAGTHAPGNLGIGTQTFSNALDYSSGSIFQWQLDSPLDTLGINNEGNYDKVIANNLSGSDSVFQILLAAGDSFSDPFWNSTRTWDNIFTAANTPSIASLFSGGFGGMVGIDGTVMDQGQFSFSGSTLTWSAVPEPSNALMGLGCLLPAVFRRNRPKAR